MKTFFLLILQLDGKINRWKIDEQHIRIRSFFPFPPHIHTSTPPVFRRSSGYSTKYRFYPIPRSTYAVYRTYTTRELRARCRDRGGRRLPHTPGNCCANAHLPEGYARNPWEHALTGPGRSGRARLHNSIYRVLDFRGGNFLNFNIGIFVHN